MKVDLNYKNKIKRFLRDEYGVNITESNFKNGTNHPYVEFLYQRKPIRITLQSSTRETNLSMMKIQDIRRTLGPPLYAFRNDMKAKRSLEMMTKEVELEARATGRFSEAPLPNAQIQATGKISFLQTAKGYRLVMNLPKEAQQALGTAPIKIIKSRDDTWEISSVRKGTLHVSNRGEVSTSDITTFPDNLMPFGRSLADMLISPGYIIVTVNPNNKMRILHNNRRSKHPFNKAPVIETPSAEAPVIETPSAEAPVIETPRAEVPVHEVSIDKNKASKTAISMTPSEMRSMAVEAVRMARELEERTPYRLASVRLPDGSKVWRAVVDVIE